jgi:hypothetical protein
VQESPRCGRSQSQIAAGAAARGVDFSDRVGIFDRLRSPRSSGQPFGRMAIPASRVNELHLRQKQIPPDRSRDSQSSLVAAVCDNVCAVYRGQAQEREGEISSPEACDGAEFSLRRPTTLQEQSGKKKRRLAAFEMTVGAGGVGQKQVPAGRS